MPEEKQTDDIEKVLSDLKSIEPRKDALIDDLLRQKAEAVKAFDEKLAKLGYQAKDGAGKSKKSHHKQAAAAPPRKIRIQKRGHPGSMPGRLALLAARFRPRREPVLHPQAHPLSVAAVVGLQAIEKIGDALRVGGGAENRAFSIGGDAICSNLLTTPGE